VCLLGASALGTECLKNLILPACGSFTIVDEGRVEVADLGANFFLDPDALGTSKAEAAVRLLGELNPEAVVGQAIATSPAALIRASSGGGSGSGLDGLGSGLGSSNDLRSREGSRATSPRSDPGPAPAPAPHFFRPFTLVISSQLDEDSLLLLSDILWSLRVPLVVTETYGFYGYCRIAIPEHVVLEGHQGADAASDLRLDVPFGPLREWAEGLDLAAMDAMQLGHVPYVLLLLRALLAWKASVGVASCSMGLSALAASASAHLAMPDPALTHTTPHQCSPFPLA
jgi:amyloid beta precursor protein binding protein 1